MSLQSKQDLYLVSSQLQNTSPWLALNLSLRYGHMILVSGYLVLTGVNWPWYGCPKSKKCDIKGALSLSTSSMAAILSH